jgi:hypothetical protein
MAKDFGAIGGLFDDGWWISYEGAEPTEFQEVIAERKRVNAREF